jgi:hypothetical protein
MWTRVLSWDEKWIYFVSHFVVKGKVVPECVLQGGKGKGKGKEKKMEPKHVFASSIARYVFKDFTDGSKTIPPREVLMECNLLPKELGPSDVGSGGKKETLDDLQAQPIKAKESLEMEEEEPYLAIAQMKAGWDAVHGLFWSDKEEVLALGKYTDLLWR